MTNKSTKGSLDIDPFFVKECKVLKTSSFRLQADF